MMSLHPKLIDLTLDRMWRILGALDHPERAPARHPHRRHQRQGIDARHDPRRAGRRGLRVHAYTSPHLVRFHERIRLAGDLIEEDRLSDILDRCLAANGPDAITYFEITTAAAFVAFAETPPT
jgi:dihydrofolate synthase/folylpolyglutamate synthase